MIFFEEQKCSLGSKMQNKHYNFFLDKGFPKGGGGGGGSDVWEKFPNNVVFFLKAYLTGFVFSNIFNNDNAKSPVIIFVPSRHRGSQYLVMHPQIVGPACLEYFNGYYTNNYNNNCNNNYNNDYNDNCGAPTNCGPCWPGIVQCVIIL